MLPAPDTAIPEIAVLRRALVQARAEEATAHDRVRRLTHALSRLERPRRPAIGEKRIDAVHVHLQHRGPCRQSDIARELSMNPGSVSVALRTLTEEGLIRALGTRNRSRVWEWARPDDSELQALEQRLELACARHHVADAA